MHSTALKAQLKSRKYSPRKKIAPTTTMRGSGYDTGRCKPAHIKNILYTRCELNMAFPEAAAKRRIKRMVFRQRYIIQCRSIGQCTKLLAGASVFIEQ